MPEYPDGDIGLRKHVAAIIRYPISAQVNGIMGRVYVQFVVDTTGKVCDVFSVCKEAPVLMKEAERVVNELNYWKPGKQEGKEVKVSYTVPINFVLN